MTGLQEDRLSWVYEDPALASRLDAAWPSWDEAGDSGMAAVLDQTPDWTGWDGWSADEKRSRLAETLNQWYPPGVADAGPETDRIAWVREDPELTGRLNASWPGWDDSGTSGLAAVLDQTPDWVGWDQWDPHARRDYLIRTLDAWYPPAPADQPAPSADHGADHGASREAAAPSSAEPAAPQLSAGLAGILAQARDAVPGAAGLSADEISQVLAEVLAEEMAAIRG